MMLVHRGLMALGLWAITGCDSPKPPPPQPAADPISVTIRLFQKQAPTQLRIAGPFSIQWDDSPARVMQSTTIHASKDRLRTDRGQSQQIRIAPLHDRLRLEGTNISREIIGSLTLTSADGVLRIIAEMSLEDYVAGVVAAEMSAAAPQAHRAQAIVARTYALRQRGRHKTHDYCDLTHCQAFKGIPPATIERRVKETKGRYLADANGPAEVFYSSTCGGHTADAHATFGIKPTPALSGVDDRRPSGRPWCDASPHSKWRFTVSANELAKRWNAPAPARLHIHKADSGWVTQVDIEGLKKPISGSRFHLKMGRMYGWSRFKSAHFQLTENDGTLHFEGRGLGHGVGLCQYGAMARAKAGQSAEAILQHYFPGLRIAEL